MVGGYAFNTKGDNYAARGSRVIVEQSKKFIGIDFFCCSYLDLFLPEKSLIYCDPPYKGTTRYRDNFNYEEFYCWCREKVKDGHIVFVSEYDCPKDFETVCVIDHKSNLNKNLYVSRTEKLFRVH